jgi:hypothetical protein
MDRRQRIAFACAVLLSSCVPQVTGMRMGVPRAAREPGCSLDVVAPTDMKTLMKYEQIGLLRVSNVEAGTDPMAPNLRDLIRPEACALGGEAISVMGSGNVITPVATTSAYASYIVWGRRMAASAAPQKF